MCGRYTLTETDMLLERYGIDDDFDEPLRDNYNVAPTQTMPVVREVDGQRKVELMRWGIPRFIGPGKVKDVFNTRADKAFWTWKKLTLGQRVLVPATGFYEWRAEAGGKQPYYIHPKDEKLFSFAGIWNAWKGEDGQVVNTYSIITTEPNEDMLSIHNRMPVILHRKDEKLWISQKHNNNQEFLEELLLPYDDGGLELYEVSKDVNTARTNEARLMYPLNSK
jgi:putative SOS response-associated peptidase YedK